MGTLNIKNTATDWFAFLESLAEEAKRDADATPKEFALHGVLADLSLVACAYAGRLDVERGKAAAAAPSYVVPEPADEWASTAQEAMDAQIEAQGAQPPTTPAPLAYDWIVDALALQAKRIAELEDRVLLLENNQQRDVIDPAPLFEIDRPDAPIDDNPDAWDSIDRGRLALRSMVAREHRSRAQIRQKILDRVVSIARTPGLNEDSALQAELRQHQARAEELGQIDTIAAVKIDEIAGLDDLDAARDYAAKVKKGWPE